MRKKIDELYQEYLEERLKLIISSVHVKDRNNGLVKIWEQWIGYNYIDSNGKKISPDLSFNEVDYFYEGYAKVCIFKKRNEVWTKVWNFIDTNGKILSPNLWFDMVWKFENGYALVKKHGYGFQYLNNYINTKGELISKTWISDD